MFVHVKPLAEIPPGSFVEMEQGEKSYAVANVDGQLFCIDGICPHAGGPLGQGFLSGDKIVCPWHGWEFDCHTGASDTDEDQNVATYPVVVKDGNVLIDLP